MDGGGDALWHVTVTVTGEWMDPVLVHAALCRLAAERPFMLGGRYGPTRAELSYWEESPTRIAAEKMARGVWREHRQSAALPAWHVLSIVAVSRQAYLERAAGGDDASQLASRGGWQPF